MRLVSRGRAPLWLALLGIVLVWKVLEYGFFVEHGTEPGRAFWLAWGPVVVLALLVAYKVWREGS